MRISVEGADPENASWIVLMLHGGGSSAIDFLGLSQSLSDDPDICWLAPQAMGERWYPGPTSESRGQKEPYFTIAVESLKGLLEKHAEQRIVLLGFGDGAGLACELLSQRPPGVVAAWIASGGMVGETTEWPKIAPPLVDVTVLVSGSQNDPQTDVERLRESADHFRAAGAKVSLHLYDGSSHHIEGAEIEKAQELIRKAFR